jgi:very-short-patch-repair endonuclease
VVDTLVDLATLLRLPDLERTVNEAVNRDLTDPERLREALTGMRRRRGVRTLVALLDRDTYVVTESILEQRSLRIARRAGLPKPTTQRRLGGGRVDFVWLDIKLIVEADSLRFHRTAAQQRKDVLRDQAHFKAGLIPLRFTHWQMYYDAAYVAETLTGVVASRTLRRPGSALIAAAS